VQHALVRVMGPLFERKFICDTYACRTGKGTHNAVAKVQQNLKTAGAKWGRVYALKADIRKYFPSVDHGRLLEIMARTIRDRDVLWLCETIIRNCGANGRGIPVGALTSQLFANIYLGQLDHFIKDNLGTRFYVRYMDDWIVLGPNKPQLWETYNLAGDFLDSKLGLSFNPKTQIFPANRGVDFCGYRIWATHLLPRKRNVKRMKARLKRIKRGYEKGTTSLDEARSAIKSFLGYMRHCDGYDTTRHILSKLTLSKNQTS